MRMITEGQPDCDARTWALIAAVLDESAAGWNTADLPRFMESYADRDDVLYVSRGQLVTGRAAIEAVYRDVFAHPGAMGKYFPNIVACRRLANDHAHVLNRFRLARDVAFGGGIDGFASLLFARIGGCWRIVADHV